MWCSNSTPKYLLSRREMKKLYLHKDYMWIFTATLFMRESKFGNNLDVHQLVIDKMWYIDAKACYLKKKEKKKETVCWYLLQHGQTSEKLCKMEEIRRSRSYNVWFHLHETSIKGKFYRHRRHISSGQGLGEEQWLIANKHKAIFWGDGNALKVDCSDGD